MRSKRPARFAQPLMLPEAVGPTFPDSTMRRLFRLRAFFREQYSASGPQLWYRKNQMKQASRLDNLNAIDAAPVATQDRLFQFHFDRLCPGWPNKPVSDTRARGGTARPGELLSG